MFCEVYWWCVEWCCGAFGSVVACVVVLRGEVVSEGVLGGAVTYPIIIL